MIYTLTLNPSLDYTLELDQITLGELNRSEIDHKFPGGKGINVSQVLNTLNVNSTTLGFLGGFTGAYIEKQLTSLGITTDFIPIEEDTRINVKLKSHLETEINAKGPQITTENFTDLKSKMSQLSGQDTLVLAGSIPSSLPSTTYEELVKIVTKNGADVVVDAEGDLLKRVLPFRPLLIKPNQHELGGLFNTTIRTGADAIPYAKKLIAQGAQHVIVSLAGDGAILVSKDVTLMANVPKGIVKGSVGAGDSMVAGFISQYQQGQPLDEAFRFSVATGSATAFSYGLCTKEKIDQLLPEIMIKKV